jgi:hypothetical protein
MRVLLPLVVLMVLGCDDGTGPTHLCEANADCHVAEYCDQRVMRCEPLTQGE